MLGGAISSVAMWLSGESDHREQFLFGRSTESIAKQALLLLVVGEEDLPVSTFYLISDEGFLKRNGILASEFEESLPTNTGYHPSDHLHTSSRFCMASILPAPSITPLQPLFVL